jgi:prepilin-type N-terminal cleavage/methylation domain-containing protein
MTGGTKMINRTTRMRGRKEDGFTLLELLIVIGIIGLLAAFLGLAVIMLKKKAPVENTRAMLKKIEIGCNAYQNYFPRQFPPRGTPDTNTTALAGHLSNPLKVREKIDPVTGQGPARTIAPLVEFKPHEISTAGNILDYWKREIHYRDGSMHTTIPLGKDTRGAFDLWSDGPPTASGAYVPDNWVTNWSEQ